MATSTHDSGNHSLCDPDSCFAAKMAYWRERGAPLKFTYGKDRFHGPTIRERQEKILADAKAEGRDVRLVNPTYDRVGSK